MSSAVQNKEKEGNTYERKNILIESSTATFWIEYGILAWFTMETEIELFKHIIQILAAAAALTHCSYIHYVLA